MEIRRFWLLDIECPNCKKHFEWTPPTSVTSISYQTPFDGEEAFRKAVMESLNKKEEKKRYSVNCPSCKSRLNITV